MKTYLKRISVLLAILMIFSSFSMLGASATTLGEDGTELDDIWVVGGDDARSILQGFLINHSWDDESWFRSEFTKESFAVYNAEYHNASSVAYDENATEEQLKSAYDSLLNAYYALEYVESNEQLREALKTRIENIERNWPVGGTPYTRESYKKFSDAMAHAKEVADDESSKRSDIIGSGNLLTYYYNKLEYSTAERQNLWNAIVKLEEAIERQDDYPDLYDYKLLRDINTNAHNIYFYEPEQSVIDEWERKIYIALGTQNGADLTDPTSESVINYSEPVSETVENSTDITEPTAPDSGNTDTTDPEPLWMTALHKFEEYIKTNYPDDYDFSKVVALGELEDCALIYGYGIEMPVEGGEITIGNYKIWAPATTPWQSAGLFVYRDGGFKILKDAYADGDIKDVDGIINLIMSADKSLGFVVTNLTEDIPVEPTLALSDGLSVIQQYIKDAGIIVLDNVDYAYLNSLRVYGKKDGMIIFGLRNQLNAFFSETIGGYVFQNPLCYGSDKNITGLCVFDGNAGISVYSIKEAVENDKLTAEYLASIIPNTIKDSGESSITEQTNETDPQPSTPEATPTQPETYKLSKAKVASVTDKTYTGKAITPTVKVTYDGKTLVQGKDYTVSYKNNKSVGTATATIKGIGVYTGTISKTFKIVKAQNPITVKAAVKTVMYSKVKKAKQTVSALTVKNAKGKVTCKKSSGSKYLTVSSSGKITVKKGTRKGAYKIKIKVTAAGSDNYKDATKTVAVTVKVK